MSLVLTGRNEARLNEAAHEIRRARPRVKVETVASDLSTRSGVSALLDHVGDLPIEVLVNNAARKINLQILMWPIVDADFETESYKEFGENRFLTTPLMKWMYDLYTTDPRERKEIYASPLQATVEQLRGLPPALIQSRRATFCATTSSMGGLFTPPGYGVYVSTKHALEALAEAMQQKLRPFGIKVQTINPGAYLTGYNETMADTAFRWLDDSRNFTKRAEMRATFDSLLGTPEGRLDPEEMIGRMVEIVPADTGKFRNVVPQFVEDMLKKHQLDAWNNQI